MRLPLPIRLRMRLPCARSQPRTGPQPAPPHRQGARGQPQAFPAARGCPDFHSPQPQRGPPARRRRPAPPLPQNAPRRFMLDPSADRVAALRTPFIAPLRGARGVKCETPMRPALACAWRRRSRSSRSTRPSCRSISSTVCSRCSGGSRAEGLASRSGRFGARSRNRDSNRSRRPQPQTGAGAGATTAGGRMLGPRRTRMRMPPAAADAATDAEADAAPDAGADTCAWRRRSRSSRSTRPSCRSISSTASSRCSGGSRAEGLASGSRLFGAGSRSRTGHTSYLGQ
jgi:hypothetical protein